MVRRRKKNRRMGRGKGWSKEGDRRRRIVLLFFPFSVLSFALCHSSHDILHYLLDKGRNWVLCETSFPLPSATKCNI